MESQHPLVSVIMPAYNRSELTIRAVDSVLAQTYKNIELIVVDDGSTDDTKNRLLAYGNQLKYIHKANGGVCSARNVGIAHASGDYIALLDSDDCYMPDKIKEGVKFLLASPDFGMVHTDAYWIDGHDRILQVNKHPKRRKAGWIAKTLIMGNYISNPTVMARRECFHQAGIYDEALFPPADWDMWLRISERNKVGHIPKPLSKYRVISNSCFNDLERTYRETAIVLEKFFERNPHLKGQLKSEAYASFHLSMAQCFLLKNNLKRMNEELALALEENPAHIKAHIFRLWYMLGQNNLKERLRKKIEFNVQAA